MRPVLAVAGTPATLARVRPLLVTLGRHVDVVSWRAHAAADRPAPAAVLATEVGVLAQLPAVPVAVWVDGPSDLAAAEDHGARVVLADHLLAGAGSLRVVPGRAIDLGGIGAAAPLVRSRRREAAGLLPVLVADPAPGEPIGTALLDAASAVVAGDDDLLAALARGAPVVTSPELAAALGARPGVELEVAPADDARSAALRLALDPERAAARSAAGRRFVEETLDLSMVARGLLADLALAAPPRPGLATLDHRLDELATPPDGWLRARTDAATDLLARPPRSATAMAEPASPSATGISSRLRSLVSRLVAPVRARVRSEIERAVADDRADLRDEVARLRDEVGRLRAEQAAELALLQEERLAGGQLASNPPTDAEDR